MNFDIYRNGAKIATVAVKYSTDTLQKKGTYIYKVCATAVSICSNTAPVTF
jgi:NADH:ubiquinone oxidoreductase subunit E